jgi:catechol 2,3-dioxygenase-like lactoylglutathione lyase family enzyme
MAHRGDPGHDDPMEQRIDIVTLGVHDVAAAREFYVEGLGWEIALEVPGDIVFVQVNHGLLLAFFGADDLAADVAPGSSPAPVAAPPPMSLAQVVADEDEVVAVCERARAAGATVLKEPQAADFGGFHCYFADPSGFHWEVATNPGWRVGADGRVTITPIEA